MRIERAGYNVYGRLDNADGSVSVKADEAAGRLCLLYTSDAADEL